MFDYSQLYGAVSGGQAQYLRVPHADYGPIKVGSELSDDRYLFLSDIIPTAWQGVKYANVPDGGTLTVYGLGPVGQFAAQATQRAHGSVQRQELDRRRSADGRRLCGPTGHRRSGDAPRRHRRSACYV